MTIRGNGTVKTISINQRKGPLLKLPDVLVYYNLAEGLTEEEEDCFIRTQKDIFAVETITLLENVRIPLPSGADLYRANLRKADFAAADLDIADLVTTLPTPDSATYPEHFYTFTKGKVQVDETPVRDKLGDMKVAT